MNKKKLEELKKLEESQKEVIVYNEDKSVMFKGTVIEVDDTDPKNISLAFDIDRGAVAIGPDGYTIKKVK